MEDEIRWPEYGASNLVTLVNNGSITGDSTVYTNPKTALDVVVVSMSLGSTSGSSGVAAAIQHGPGLALIFSGELGAGLLDCFVWQGRVVLAPGEQLVFETTGPSTWTLNATGYYVPRFDQRGYFG